MYSEIIYSVVLALSMLNGEAFDYDKDEVCNTSVKVTNLYSNSKNKTGFWNVISKYPDIFGIKVSYDASGEYSSSLYLDVAEFLRDDPLETLFRAKINISLKVIDGVVDTIEQDRELWLIKGEFDGALLADSIVGELRLLCPEIIDYLSQ